MQRQPITVFQELCANPFFFLGINAVSFGIDRVEQLPADIAELNRNVSDVVVISDSGVTGAGIPDRIRRVLERSGYAVKIFSELTGEPYAVAVHSIGHALAGENIEPETLASVMVSAENMPMLENNARPISQNDALELARMILTR